MSKSKNIHNKQKQNFVGFGYSDCISQFLGANELPQMMLHKCSGINTSVKHTISSPSDIYL